ncbi:MAG: lipopolysaccharide biosynthesis protein [Bdellovibrionales bacterium]|nr:lipopolysaccharide biosynthesis protein [Bdellovibrionales bacterium]
MTEEVESVSRRARSGLIWLGSTNAVWQLFSWVLTVLTARQLAPSDYGLVAMIESVAPYLALIAALNLHTWIIQTETLDADDEKAVLTLTTIFGAIIASIAFFSAPYVAQFYQTPELEMPFRILSISFLFKGIYTVPESLLRRDLQFKPVALIKLSIGILRSVVQLVLAYKGFGYWALVIGMLIREFGWLVCFSAIRGLPKGFCWKPELFKRALAFGLPATGGHIFWIVFSTADEVVIGRLFGVETLGLYALAFMLIDMPLAKINEVVRPVIIPFFSRIKTDRNALERGFLKTVRGVCALVFPALLGLAVVAPDFVPLVLGETWEPMVVVLQVLCVVGLFRAFIDNAPPLLLALGLPKKELQIHFISALMFPPLFYLLGKVYGLFGVLGGWLIGLPVLAVVALTIAGKEIGMRPLDYIYNLKIPIICSGAMLTTTIAAAALLQDADQIYRFIAIISVGALTYGSMLWGLYKPEVLEMVKGKPAPKK